ncbi:putative 4-coumarate--CoA ligase-like 8 [Panicum miliaceum]|uniref:4-coumarate--CoA ligase n=1 Tax=Panicum miliaceum TaxID=4540 RepID=A0A3L6PB57_PANMI|nr:putative 4-coumarate--CoA ligase-like 8 [Panicum miliaceum]
MDTEAHLTAGYCAATGTYSSRHPPLATAAAASFPDYLFPRLLTFPPPAFVDACTGATLSFPDLRTLSLKAAAALSALGLRRGHVALLLAPSSLHFPAVSLGVLSLGALLAGLAGHDAWAAGASSIGRDDPALLFYSSGTTGRSKSVVSTHGNVIAAAAFLQHVWRRRGGGDAEDVYGCVLPMFHMFGFSAFVLGTPAIGATAVLVPGRFSVDRLMAAMEEHRVTRLLAVPPMVVQMAKKLAAGEPSPTSSARRLCLREVVSSGAPLQRDHMARFASCFPRVSLVQCYGLTETTGIVTMCDLSPLPHGNGNGDGVESSNKPPPASISIGRLVPSTEARIVDAESGESLPPNRVGELATCSVDSRGLVHVVDRIKELIKYKAYQVAPAELEDVLAAHPDIHDAAVAPYPDEEAGEIPVACVVRKPWSNQPQAQDVLSFVQSKVAPYRKVRRVVFVDCIPRSPSGKILRAQLKSFLRTTTCEMHGGAELQATTRV